MLSDQPIAAPLFEQPFTGGGDYAVDFHARSIPLFWKSRNWEYGRYRTYSACMERNATNALSQRLHTLKARKGWTLVELSKRSGVSKSAISNLLNYHDQNDSHPSTRAVEQLGAAFGLSAWQMLKPDDAVAETEPLDAELLATTLVESADVFRALNRLPSFEQLAGAAVRMYNEVQTGIPMRQATESVARSLQQIRNGTILAAPNQSSARGAGIGQSNKRADRRGKERTR